MNLPFFPKKANEKIVPDSSSKPVSPAGGLTGSAGEQIARFSQGMVSVQDIIAPPAIEVDFNHLKIGNRFFRTLFVAGYPRFVSANWLSPLINFDHSLDIAMYIYPVEGKGVLDDLRRKIAEMEAEIQIDIEKGRVVDPATQAKLEDARVLQEQLVKGAERFFQFGLYVTVPADSLEELNQVSKQVISTLGSLLIIAKQATLQMEEGFKTTIPTAIDRLMITRNMDTTSLATTFPFTSSELSANEGVLYGINEHNESLIIFDRFSLENANSVLFAKAGAGKSSWAHDSVLFDDGKGPQIGKIGPLVERIIAKGTVAKIEEGIEGIVNPGLKVFTFDNQLKGEWAKVTVAARKKFSKRNRLYRISTKSGREITVTADHNLVVLRNGKIRALRSEAAKVGEWIPLSRFLPQPTHPIKEVTFTEQADQWPEYLPRKAILTPLFLSLLGLTTSEGCTSQNRWAVYSTNGKIKNIIRRAFQAIGAKTSPAIRDFDEKGRMIIAGWIARPQNYVKLALALGAGGKSAEKRVPPIIFSLSNKQVGEYLRAYFEGDGTVNQHEVSCSSKSKELISDLAYLLLRFGIAVRIKKKLKRATNAKHRGDYYHELVISGQENLKSFTRNIGFLTKEKDKKLKKLLAYRANTNVDVIPTLGPILQKIYQALYSSTEIKAPSYLVELRNGKKSPSRARLKKLVTEIEKRIQELREMRQRILFVKRLPDLQVLQQRVSRNRKLSRLAWRQLGQSWRLIKHQQISLGLVNVLRLQKTINGETITVPEVKEAIYSSFATGGFSLQKFDQALWTSITQRKASNVEYQKVFNAALYLRRQYCSLQLKIRHAEEKLSYLKLLADSDLFWDPIVKIKKIKHKERFVYDLTVDNEVFLAGHGGLFVHNSYLVKLESLRSLMFGTEIMVIDPEAEYKALCEAVGGAYITFGFQSQAKINPFDLSTVYREGENELGQKILTLHSLFKVIMGSLNPSEEAVLDRALVLTYKQKGITPDPATQKKEPPLMEDLYKTLRGMEEPQATGLADRLEKYVKGSFVGIFDQYSNVDLNNPFVVFSIRDLEEALRPIAMFIILDYIWTKIRKEMKRRILVVDEAWYMMKYPDSANFMYSIAKRARKYYLGLTTITQDVEDFLSSDYGKAIVSNSSLQILMKQSPASIDKVAEVFYLSEGEKHLLLSAEVGEGLFFAGANHVAIRVVASTEEHQLITTKPQEILAQREKKPISTHKTPTLPIQPPPLPNFGAS